MSFLVGNQWENLRGKYKNQEKHAAPGGLFYVLGTIVTILNGLARKNGAPGGAPFLGWDGG